MTHTMISELSIVEFKELIRETVNEAIQDALFDPDEGLILREEVAQYIIKTRKAFKAGELETTPMEEVAKELGLEW